MQSSEWLCECSEVILNLSTNKNKYRHSKNKTNKKQTVQRQNRPTFNNADVSAQNPIDNNNQIISGYFLDEKPYKEMIIQRVNNFLYVVLGILVLFCLVCYYFVSCKEVQLNQISRATLELNYENEELQNKVDSLQSYYNIDKAVSKTNLLERAKHVVEVDAIDLPNLNFNKTNKKKHSLVVSY